MVVGSPNAVNLTNAKPSALALLFLFSGGMKLAGSEEVATNFGRFGYPVVFAYLPTVTTLSLLDQLDPALTVDSLIHELVPQTEGFSGADLAYLSQAAKLRALDELDYSGDPRLTMRHLTDVLSEVLSSRG